MPKVFTNIWLVLVALLGITLSFVNQQQLAELFGTSNQRDSYFLANILLTFLLTIHYQSIVLLFLPQYTIYKNTLGKKGLGQEFIWLHFIGLGVIVVMIILVLHLLIYFQLLPFTSDDLLVKLTTLLLLSFVFQATTNLVGVTYQVVNQYILPALQNVFIFSICILVVYFFHQKGIIVLAWGYLGGNILALAFLLFIKRKVFLANKLNKIKVSFRFIKMAAPFALVAILSRLIQIVEPFFIGNQKQGVISYLGYSYQMILLLLTLFSSSILATFFTKLSSLDTQKELKKIEMVITKTLDFSFYFCLSIAIFLALYGQEIISVLFEKGNFKQEDSIAVYKVFRWELATFVFSALSLLLSRFFYLVNDRKTLYKAGVWALVVYIIAAYSFYNYFVYEGLGIALSIWAFTYFVILFSKISSILPMNIKKNLFSLLNIFLTFSVFYFFLYLTKNYLSINTPMQVIVVASLYMFFTFIFLWKKYKNLVIE